MPALSLGTMEKTYEAGKGNKDIEHRYRHGLRVIGTPDPVLSELTGHDADGTVRIL